MKKININKYKGKLEVNQCVEGETLETKIERILNNNEPITDSAPQIYTDRKDGVLPEYNIRTDRFEIAIEAMDKVNKTYRAKRQELILEREKGSAENQQGGTSIQATE